MSSTTERKAPAKKGRTDKPKRVSTIGLLKKTMDGDDRGPFKYLNLYRQGPLEIIGTIKEGVPALLVKRLAGDLKIEQRGFLSALNMNTSSLNRRVSNEEDLPIGESERIVGIARLVGQVEAMVNESGDPEGFNAAEWLSRWLREPLPALGGKMPIEFLGTIAGQSLISQMLSRLQSGAYA